MSARKGRIAAFSPAQTSRPSFSKPNQKRQSAICHISYAIGNPVWRCESSSMKSIIDTKCLRLVKGESRVKKVLRKIRGLEFAPYPEGFLEKRSLSP
jgi:hypothetical protein